MSESGEEKFCEYAAETIFKIVYVFNCPNTNLCRYKKHISREVYTEQGEKLCPITVDLAWDYNNKEDFIASLYSVLE